MTGELYFDRMVKTRFIIPLKIVIGAFIATFTYTLLNQGKDLTAIYTYVGETIIYSIMACLMFTIGDFVIHLGSRIYRKIATKEDESE